MNEERGRKGQERSWSLLHKELDGDISDVERDELDRLALRSPALRQERAGWSRVEESISGAVSQPSLPSVDRMAERVLARRRDESSQPSHRWLVAAGAIAAVALVGLVQTNETSEELSEAPPQAVVIQAPTETGPVAHHFPRSGLGAVRTKDPVQVNLHDLERPDDADEELVTIRF